MDSQERKIPYFPERKEQSAFRKTLNAIFLSALVGIIILSTIHCIQTGLVNECITVTISVLIFSCTFALLLVLILFISRWVGRDSESWTKKNIIEELYDIRYWVIISVGIAFALTGFTPAFYFVIKSVQELLTWIFSPSRQYSEALPVITFLTLFVGIILFCFRLYLRSLYGITEIAVGLLVAMNRIIESDVKDPKLYLTLLTAGIYLVVRGLDNAHQGFIKPDPFALKVFSTVNKLKDLSERFRFST